MLYTVRFTDAAAKDIERLPEPVKARVQAKARELAVNPRPPGVKKLKAISDLWRLRVGDYRIIYSIQDAELVVLIVKVAHRREVYR